jgi:hypothetical protein
VLRWIGIGLVCVVLVLGAGVWLLGSGWLGRHEVPGEVARATRPTPATVGRQILFGDLHVHTTFSADAFLFSLPILGGEGAHPPADACDFARFCSALDFWSINDHAEALTPEHWQETVESIRACNEQAGDPANPDVVAFLGWEWTQVGATPERHYGHKNVVLAHTDDPRIPTRPIAARREDGALRTPGLLQRAAMAAILRDERSLDMVRYNAELAGRTPCTDGVPVRDLPADCTETVATPGELFAKLDEWGHDAIVIPHGTAWGWTADGGADWARQLDAAQQDPDRQRLIEVFSGHGNSEEYRPWRAVELDGDGRARCPAPSDGYLPSCWRAGEIIRERCLAAGEPPGECESRAAEARALHVGAGKSGLLTVPGARAEDWLDAGQCRDCYLPAFDLRPMMSVQSIVARGDGQRMGFIASSDIHTARPGTGYKEFGRRAVMTDARGPVRPAQLPGLAPAPSEPEPRARPVEGAPAGFGARDTERVASFLYTGGLVAVHADNRSREGVWSALRRKETYGTSGDRILLWFDLVNGEGAPMGSSVALDATPRFEVRAVGAWDQKPGCPDYATDALSPERLHRLCRGECYNPGDTRRRMQRIEVVRIRPRTSAAEPLHELIEDPWRTFPCPDDPSGCAVSFEDPDFVDSGRSAVYYVRAIQEPTPTVNGDTLRCESNAEGRCVRSRPCYGGWQTPADDECLAVVSERAWSSPIWVDLRD